MDEAILLGTVYHRTRKRIRELGEVFTPEQYVEDMLNLLGNKNSSIWFDLDIVFFEPCCGHGNIVVSVLTRRVKSINNKASRESQPVLYAVANAIDSLWAIDIDSHNIKECRSRVWSYCLNYILENTSASSLNDLIQNHLEYFTHLLCAIKWHIFENETLSALSDHKTAKLNADKTKFGAKWFNRYGYNPIDFEKTWCAFYCSCDKNNLTPMEYEKAKQFLLKFLLNRQLSPGFEFANDYLDISNKRIDIKEG